MTASIVGIPPPAVWQVSLWEIELTVAAHLRQTLPQATAQQSDDAILAALTGAGQAAAS